MSASQQVPDSRSGVEVILASPEPRSATMAGAVAAIETETGANGAEVRSAPDQFADDAIQAIVERDVSSEDVQPMLDLRFPDEPQSARIEPEVHSHVATPAEPTAGIKDADFAEIPPHEQTFDETNGSQPRIEAGFEQPFDVAADSPDTDLPTVANETSEGIHQPVAETLVSLPSIGEATPEPEYHAEVIDTATDDHGRFPDDPESPEADAPPRLELDDQETTSQKIAAEASATAEALENLKRLLAHKMPSQTGESVLQRPPFLRAPSPPALQAIEPVQSEPAQQEDFPSHRPQVVIDPPELAFDAYHRRGGFEIRGFLAGFALSWALGAALYVYLVFS